MTSPKIQYCIIFLILFISSNINAQTIYGPFVPYSTTKFFIDAITLSPEERAERSRKERFLFDFRSRRVDVKLRTITLKFHNMTSLNADGFQNEVLKQLTFLRSSLKMTERTYISVFSVNPEAASDLDVFDIQEESNNYNPINEPWRDWNSFQQYNSDGPRAINVFVTNELPDSLGHGYAKFSWINRSNMSDIVIRASSFGTGSSSFLEGKVFTHLLGNYYGLIPLNGFGNCEDDNVQDTPIHNAAAAFCFDGRQPTSICDNQFFLTNNFMSHSPDGCKNSFTRGQWKRMLRFYDFLPEYIPPVPTVPTLGQWSCIILGLCLLILGVTQLGTINIHSRITS